MAKVIPFKNKKKKNQNEKLDKVTYMLLSFSQEIDETIVGYMTKENLDPKELAGVLAHRLGSLLNLLDEKEDLWEICENVLRKQAKLIS